MKHFHVVKTLRFYTESALGLWDFSIFSPCVVRVLREFRFEWNFLCVGPILENFEFEYSSPFVGSVMEDFEFEWISPCVVLMYWRPRVSMNFPVCWPWNFKILTITHVWTLYWETLRFFTIIVPRCLGPVLGDSDSGWVAVWVKDSVISDMLLLQILYYIIHLVFNNL